MELRGYIANTDFDWHTFLCRRQPLDEVNFWKPSASSFQAPPGMPFLFKLKRPHYAVAGFGIFARYSCFPMSLAWDLFREKNGAPDFDTMKRLIDRYHHTGSDGPRFDYDIGCIMVAEPVLFNESDWISQPADWPRNVVAGKHYDLTQGEGRRIWEACLLRSRDYARRHVPADGPLPAVAEGARFGSPHLVEPRLGQGTFRIAVTDAYGRACAVTTEHTLPALEAAHIQRYSRGGQHRVSNGILLRADIHRLFDHGYVTITPDHTFHVSRRIEEVFKNGRSYYPLDGQPIQLPPNESDCPDRRLLEQHNDTVFLG